MGLSLKHIPDCLFVRLAVYTQTCAGALLSFWELRCRSACMRRPCMHLYVSASACACKYQRTSPATSAACGCERAYACVHAPTGARACVRPPLRLTAPARVRGRGRQRAQQLALDAHASAVAVARARVEDARVLEERERGRAVVDVYAAAAAAARLAVFDERAAHRHRAAARNADAAAVVLRARPENTRVQPASGGRGSNGFH
eukprot:3294494-Pleurochrysis_carterae.AAC.6